MATISGVWTSPGRKSGQSVGHERRRAIAGEGLEGCAHANPPKREVLFVSAAHLDSVGVDAGAIRENLTVEGADVQQWPIGQRVKVGDEAVFEITMVCDPCHRMDELRDGLRDTVLKGEWVYDDLEAGLATARKSGKPVLVLARCVP